MQSFTLYLAGIGGRLNIDDQAFIHYITKEYCFSKKNVKGPVFDIEIKTRKDNYLLYDRITEKYSLFKKSSIDPYGALDFITIAHIGGKVISHNIFLLHGSSFIKEKKAYICIGPPGAGKTTIIRNVPKNSLLSDDTAVIQKISGRFFVCPSAFDNRFNIDLGLKKSSLEKIFVLKQAKKNEFASLEPKTKIRQLIQNTVFYPFRNSKVTGVLKSTSANRKEFNRLYHLVFDLVKHVTIERLYFTKEFDLYDHV